MPSIGRALVVGGGIGGLTAGVALRKAGVEVDLVEQNPTFSVYGVGIIQPNNVLRALDEIGLAAKCVEAGTPFPGWRIHDAHGNALFDAPNASTAAPAFPPNNGITRPALQDILKDAAYASGVRVKLGTKVESLDDRGEQVEVALSDGTRGHYGLVIGSDGIYSETRGRVFGDLVTPTFTGQAVWRYNMPRPDSLIWGEIHSGPHSKVGLTPIRSDLMYMFVVTAEPDNPWMPKDRLAELMRDRLRGFTGPIAALAELIVDPAEVVYKPMEKVLLPDPWHKGRVLIIGDAAHATTPHLAQGAAMAIEDAVLLGELLGDDAPLEDVLRRFMARRFARARFVVETSLEIADMEMAEWEDRLPHDASPGALLHQASVALLESY